ncbi:disintegrin and metalloproteinase domain-containing protein 12-like isoform X2 [Hemiscyllium ocellatum]|uniref:disintegrin and metalloproteinase domain-containing protein 12-like isoform X2 n=1 Tax=Hemiscyllium ocellatum TaxID=170820 RepID=UPI002966D9E1|nr:disintegrin and metalloproteinase domain-containing protein 12-like isoform X2 [Hemiscyllium ocellatum]
MVLISLLQSHETIAKLSHSLHKMTRRLGRSGLAARLQILYVLINVTDAFVASNDGNTLSSKLSSSRQQGHLKQLQQYEQIVPYLLDGDHQKQSSNLHGKSHPKWAKFLIEAEGKQLVIELERNDVLFAENYTETHYLLDGSAVINTQNHTGHCYYHGHVQGYSQSIVSLSTCSGLRGFVSFENKSYILEPIEGVTDNTHLIYRAENLKGNVGTCGQNFRTSATTVDADTESLQRSSTRHKRDISKTTKYVELVIVADNREFQKQGKDLEKTKQRLIEIGNFVDKFYRSLNIRVALVGVEVWTDMDKCSITGDPFATLNEFLDWRKMKLLSRKPHDNAQLVSGVYFQGTTIGMAPIMSMCTAEQSGGIVMDHSDNPLGAAVTMAHELGHNFGMNHDTPERGCTCRATSEKGGCIMTPSTGYPFPTVFSSCSKKDLDSSLEKGVGMCLFNMPEVKELYGGQKCGNGYVEEGEECDCGELEECTNPCCNASTCTLKPEAVCAHGLCCKDCKLKPPGTPCRDSSNSCDLPEFCTGTNAHCPANVYLHDGQPCHKKDGYCYNGICQTHEQQCITLWGPGAKPAPGICFERVNSAGDPYGNCGKDSTGLFAKCDIRDAQCGKIQCQGGASRPVIGTNAVSIETNIPLQEGGKILCRGTHVYLGDDMPDPGLVLTGTKCGEGKICLNRQCQNISVFGVIECASKCHGQGVCNNNKNCHCDHDWAPPYCDKPGLGGSIDSGPMRLEESNSLFVGILVTILSLIAAGVIMCFKRKTLLQLLFSHKITTVEKLRTVGPTRSSTPSQSSSTYTTPIKRQANIYKTDNLQSTSSFTSPTTRDQSVREPPCYQPVHISNPLPNSVARANLHFSLTPQWVLPPLNHSTESNSGVPSRPLPAKPSFRNPQGPSMRSPPQKPLPANPINRPSQLDAPFIQHPEIQIKPVRPAPKKPQQYSKINRRC